MIDLHCPVLPGSEGGPSTDDEAVSVLEALAADGVDVAALTPSINAWSEEQLPALKGRIAALRQRAGGHRIPALLPAAELELTWALRASEDDLKLASYGQLGKTLLIANPGAGTRPDFEDLLLTLKGRGYGVLLAHPETSPSYQSEPDRLGRLVAQGVLVQLNASSLVAPPNPKTRRLARVLLEEQAAHVIASGRAATTAQMAEAVGLAEQVAGPRARSMVTDVPAAILAGAPLPAA